MVIKGHCRGFTIHPTFLSGVFYIIIVELVRVLNIAD